MAEVLGAVTTATKFFFEVILLKQSCPSDPSFLVIPQVNQISIDNWSFKCFYKITTSILLTCSLMSTTKQFFGEPIQCDLVRLDVIHTLNGKFDYSFYFIFHDYREMGE